MDTSGIRSRAAWWLCLIALFSTASHAQSADRFGVSATVQRLVILHTLSVRHDIEISASDIARGSIDVPAAMQVEISSNSPDGYQLNVQPRLAIFTHAEIVGFDAPVSIGADGATVVQRGQHARLTRFSMGYRFFLTPGLQPGIYPWPVQLSIAPL